MPWADGSPPTSLRRNKARLPQVIEAKVRLPAGSHDLVLRNELPGPSPYHQYYRTGVVDEFTTLRNGRSPYQLKLSDNDFNPIAPLLILDYMEMEAVVDPWPPEPQRRIFASGAKDEAHARSIITKFAEQAFRRPLVAGEVEQYLNVANQSQALGATFEEGVRDALTAVLCSHDFLFLVEGSDAELRDRLNDWELASRLSYFLWSTMPDEQLLEQARAGNLRDREVLLSQLQRMLEDHQMTPVQYIEQTYHVNPAGRVKLADAYHGFRETLTDRERTLWPRWRFVAEIENAYIVGRGGGSVCYVAGISHTPPEV